MNSANGHNSRKCMFVYFLQQLVASLAAGNSSTFIAFYGNANSLKGLPSDTVRLTVNMTYVTACYPAGYACATKVFRSMLYQNISHVRHKKKMIIAID